MEDELACGRRSCWANRSTHDAGRYAQETDDNRFGFTIAGWVLILL